jgi:hypothetical protein
MVLGGGYMKIKIVSFTIIISILLINNFSLVFAENIFKGEIKQVNKLYDGDCVNKEDFLIDGYCINDKGDKVDISNLNFQIINGADINNPSIEYMITDNKVLLSKGNISIEVIPFDSTVIYDNYYIKDLIIYNDVDILTVKDWVKTHFRSNIANINFKNNLGRKLAMDIDKSFYDLSNFKLTNGIYKIPYTVYFYNNNLIKSNQYDKIKGSFNIVVKDSLINNDTSTNITANSLFISDIGLSYIVNINNKLSDAVYSFSTGNSTIAYVGSKSGLITAKAKGSTTITCKETLLDGTINKYTATVTVGVTDDMPCLTDDELNLSIGDNFDLGVNNRITGSTYKYKSLNSDIVSVKTLTGKGEALSEGNTDIILTATTKDKTVYVLKCDVSVTE